eukprot:CAMPEP_0194031902 /NCGR_PEP_ID=MMETSP0009_2-20130614/4969_1 /TAXON_ID=210454 /ORGANISM="Grammatophora oceanica, Strain CCMP 410" /LENGTH=58 /DNA_ID=CAMNT_0038672173 /DNA_START=402 /DNA_END=578 /DNA_ORIENTATION=+
MTKFNDGAASCLGFWLMATMRTRCYLAAAQKRVQAETECVRWRQPGCGCGRRAESQSV